MIVIPNVKKPTDNTGIVIAGGYVYAGFTEDGVRRRRKISLLGCGEKHWRGARDAFYRDLIKKGAVKASRASKETRAAKVSKDPDKYIRKRLPFVVTIGNKVIGEFGTRKEARAARDNYLGI